MATPSFPVVPRRARATWKARLLALTAIGLLLPITATPPSSARRQAQAPVEIKPAHIVVLVDESGSISPEDMAREKEAAGLIAQAEFSPKSTVAVVGFGSDSGGVSPVDAVCPPTTVSTSAERQRLSTCVDQLRIREKDRGDGTDHAQALAQALTYLSGDQADEPKIIFLLTDGKLDVGDSERYGSGKTPDQRNSAAHDVIVDGLVTARNAKVQVWPLGFGAVDAKALDEFAAGGHQGSCGPGTPTPKSTVVTSSADVKRAIFESYSSARCAGIGPINEQQLTSGGSVEAKVDIPDIATDGSIIVIKHDPRVGVEFIAPGTSEASPKAGSADGSTYEGSGQSGPVEALRIVDPKPGTWTVRITSAAGVPAQNVSTAVTWQGAVQAIVQPGSSTLSAGQPVTVSVRLRTRRGPVTNTAVLRTLSFTAEVKGAGPAESIGLSDNGQSPDPTADDGTYTGRVTLPADATGQITFTGHVTGIGISGDHPTASATVAKGPPAVLAGATLPTITDTVAPGGTVTAHLDVTNNSGGPRKVRVQLDQDSGSLITVDDAVREVPVGNSGFDVDLRMGDGAAEGAVTAQLKLVDDADPSVVYQSFPFTTTVAKPFPWWIVIAGAALLALVGGVAHLVATRRRAADLRGLRITVGNGAGSGFLPAPASSTKVITFVVEVSAGGVPSIRPAERGDPDLRRLTRSKRGLRVTSPYGDSPPFHLDQPHDIGEGLTLTVTDETRPPDEHEPASAYAAWTDSDL
ncbi:VWA domain-containing protein [Umezawaea endophytica]|uniref:VWA domain-containing protein n=1 Tax=Umezawaea endophytica TaxID=1654476 RepID=A0A9X3AEX4_9PSEU|nr:VWA domain-containing protein [Umezawaea endophytica]MCS7477481.1 VWA domain-containing protein [Umezawaea endophytica]